MTAARHFTVIFLGKTDTAKDACPCWCKHLVHLWIESGNKKVACTALVDSGNIWRNVISKRMIDTMGFIIKGLIPVKGQQAVGTAKEGSTLRVLGATTPTGMTKI